jgi:hypothetical protein
MLRKGGASGAGYHSDSFAKLTKTTRRIAAATMTLVFAVQRGTRMRHLLLPFTPRYVLLSLAVVGTAVFTG